MTGLELKQRLQAANPGWAVNISGSERQFVDVMDGDLTVGLSVDKLGGVHVRSATATPFVPVPAYRLLDILCAACDYSLAARVPVRGAYSESDRDIEARP